MTLAMSALLVGFAAFHLSVAEGIQKREHQQYVSAMLHFIRVELEGLGMDGESEQGGLAEFEDVVLRENASRRFGKLIVHVVTSEGELLLSTSGAQDLVEQRPPFPPFTPSPAGVRVNYWRSAAGRHFVLSSLKTRSPEGRVREVKLALDWSDARAEMQRFRRRSAGVIVLCTVLAAVAAASVVRYALRRPISAIRDAADRIRQGSFDSRLGPTRLPAELAELAQSFERMQDHLQESFDRLSHFAAELAHELRTPVGNVMGQTEVALSRPRTVGEYQEVLASNLEEMARLSRMVDSLLFLAHAERGSAQVGAQQLDLAAEADSVVEYHRAEAEELDVTLTRSGHGALCADRALLRRALSNLLSNALQASSAGGEVAISIVESTAGLSITVTDQGAGIAEGDLPRVLEPFYRSHQARLCRPEGSGLGLAIVKSIVELHRGSVAVESQPGEGTTVTVRFPPASSA